MVIAGAVLFFKIIVFIDQRQYAVGLTSHKTCLTISLRGVQYLL